MKMYISFIYDDIYECFRGIHYYWNTVDDTVSWLPPSHPRAVLTKSAAVLRRELEASQPELDENEDSNGQQATDSVELDYGSESNSIREPQPKPQPLKKPKARDLEKVLRSKSERRMKKGATDGALDPMDPAAYSDVPRGKWSAGLESENTKTGADSTVIGAFQMRPYPNPGAVLRANAQKGKDGSDGSDGSDGNDSDQQDV